MLVAKLGGYSLKIFKLFSGGGGKGGRGGSKAPAAWPE